MTVTLALVAAVVALALHGTVWSQSRWQVCVTSALAAGGSDSQLAVCDRDYGSLSVR